MKFTIQRDQLVRAVSMASLAVKNESPIDAARCLLVTTEDGSVRFRGTDLSNMVITTWADADVAIKGAAAIPSKWLASISATAPAMLVVTVEGGKTIIKAAKGKTKWSGGCFPAADFPEVAEPIPSAQRFAIDSAVLGGLINRVNHAQLTDPARPHMSCVRLEVSGRTVSAVATDGHRLALAEAQTETLCPDFKHSIPHHVTKTIARLAVEHESVPLTISLSGGNDGFTHFEWAEHLVLSVRKTEDNFPPYRGIIPKTSEIQLNISRSALVDMVKRAQVASAETESKTRPVKVSLAGPCLEISAETVEKGASFDSVDIGYDGKDWSTKIASEYFLQALSVINDDDVTIKLNGPLSPFMIHGAKTQADFVSMIMVMR